MHAEPAHAESSKKLDLPQDLVTALKSSAHQPKMDYSIEALQPSLLGRLVEKLLGPKN
jgi:hypothetical protein